MVVIVMEKSGLIKIEKSAPPWGLSPCLEASVFPGVGSHTDFCADINNFSVGAVLFNASMTTYDSNIKLEALSRYSENPNSKIQNRALSTQK